MLPFAGSGALSRTVAEIAGTNSGGYVVGKTYGEVLQRMVNALSWGQLEAPENGRGGWFSVITTRSALPTVLPSAG